MSKTKAVAIQQPTSSNDTKIILESHEAIERYILQHVSYNAGKAILALLYNENTTALNYVQAEIERVDSNEQPA